MAAESELPSDDGYVLQRGFAASARQVYILMADKSTVNLLMVVLIRLNLMHYLWRDQLGYLVHPRIPITKANLAVADIGTGTGLWLLDLGRSLPPSAELHGFDISLDQCPPQEWLPSNVSFSVLDLHKDVPEDLAEKFDIIHVRHFLLVVKSGDPSPILRNLIRMLKPDGYIQWGELDFESFRPVTARHSSSTKNIEAINDYVTTRGQKSGSKIGESIKWATELGTIFRDGGLIDVTTDRLHFNKSYLSYALDTSLMTWEELSYMIFDRMGPEYGRHARELITKAYQEGRAGGGYEIDRIVTIGRKSSTVP